MLFETPYIAASVYALAVLGGLCVGSFINCWAWRLVHGKSIARGRSCCPICGHELAAADLVPLFSWMVRRGACRYCGAPISVRYPLAELVCAVAFLGIVARYGLTLEALELVCFTAVLLFLSLTDIDDWLIPNGCIIAAIVIRALYLAALALQGVDVVPLVCDSLIGGVVVLVPLVVLVLCTDKVLGRPSMGGGDLKLFFVAGLYFGWMQCLFLVIVACACGLVTALVRHVMATRGLGEDDEVHDENKREIPFGPSIAFACWVVMLCGADVTAWYLGTW